MSTASPNLLSYASASVKRGPRFHPLRRLRIERWTYSHAAMAVLMGALGVGATLEAWKDIYGLATKDSEYSHIFLVPIVSLWMIFSRRMRIRHCKPIGTLFGVLIAALGWGLYTYGYYNGYQTIWHCGAVVVVIGCILSVLGKHALFRFFPAIVVLVFLIPVPPHHRLTIAQPMQVWTAEVSEAVLTLFGVQVQRSGSNLLVNNVPVLIIEACNGLRGVFSLILVSYAFSFGLPLRNSVRFIVLLASPVSAILCNVIRVVPTAYIYGYASSQTGYYLHEVLGWLMLPISFMILLGVIRLLRWAMVPVMKYSLAA
ncbi:exosortase/archaeosortase family protein [Humisphaera borealis]|uniref:Exosortase/archaeosortase family protein n=1 Tax=Humisphaera borealis TaxID=2807512 RepID=A0A7M2X0J2_9BACT|nr:exosortase/archaeosortase family protein [Humisphaera borealis]QOV91164.1 exosortase/archaeosortase family protein [Humisphaera borealis]